MDEDDEFFCPSCSRVTDHELVSRGRNPVGKCLECGDIHPVIPARRERPVHVRAIVSDGERSRICRIEVEEGEVVRIGDTFVAACGDEYTGVEVTSIEVRGARVAKAAAGEISALWTRAIEEVALRVAIHSGRTTESLRVMVPGDAWFVVGELYTLGKRRFRISRIKIRDGGILKKPGQKAEAKRIRRVFGYPG